MSMDKRIRLEQKGKKPVKDDVKSKPKIDEKLDQLIATANTQKETARLRKELKEVSDKIYKDTGQKVADLRVDTETKMNGILEEIKVLKEEIKKLKEKKV